MTNIKSKIINLKYIILCIIFVVICTPLQAQETSVSGVVIDADTGEKLPFVQIYFIKPSSDGSLASQYGTTSDIDGNFTISNPVGYTTLNFQMIGYKTEMFTVKTGQQRKNVKIKMKPDVYGLQDIVVTPKKQKQKYKRKGNPAVELIKEVIAHKDSFQVKSVNNYRAETYHRMSFAIDNFTPNFQKGFWKSFRLIEKYIDTTGVYPAMTISIRENMGHEYYQRKPHREKKEIDRQRIFGIESVFSTQTIEDNMKSVFTDIDIYDDNMNLLFNRFVSPLSSSLAVSYYQYYIMDTIMLDGDSVIDLAFVPVNSESYSFTGHLYIVNDSTFKLKKYAINIPPHINLNFVSHFSVEHEYKKLDNGLWAPDRTNTYCKFYLVNRKKSLLARQTKLYTGFDLDTDLPKDAFSNVQRPDSAAKDSTSIREDFKWWDDHRPEPLTFYESSVMDLLDELKTTPLFNALIKTGDALMTEFVTTVPSNRWGESKWDFGPILNFISWNKLEGVRLRLGGTTTANVHKQLFFAGYVAFGTHDLRPKGQAEIMWSFNKKKYHQYEPLRDYISFTAMYDVEEPGQQVGLVGRDNMIMSIPIGTITDKYEQYILRARLQYYKDWPNQLTFKARFDYEYNEAAGAMKYERVMALDTLGRILGKDLCLDRWKKNAYHDYMATLEVRYTPGSHFPINRYGVESPFTLEQDAPVISIQHQIGYLDDRFLYDGQGNGGRGYFYNHTQITAEKRFWFSSFGHLDTRLQAGYIWNRVPFTKLYSPTTSTSILLGKNAFNQLQPSEFMFDAYVGLYMTYFFKGWILNRIPGINRLKLRGVVSFSAIYGGLTKKNNPYLPGNEGSYAFPNDPRRLTYDQNNPNIVTAGRTLSPIGKLPYMELTAGIENIFKFIRIDYVRRLTYNDYELPAMERIDANGNPMLDENGVPILFTPRRKLGAWGRNGVKITVRFAL